jgi:hypothetical protein
MKYVVALFFFIFFQFSFSQNKNTTDTISKRELSNDEFLKAKEGYLKMSLTENYKKRRDQTAKFVKSMPTITDISFYKNEEDFEKWMTENLKLTSFKTVEEAVAFRKSMVELDEEFYIENIEIFELVGRASIEQLMVILKPDFYIPEH